MDEAVFYDALLGLIVSLPSFYRFRDWRPSEILSFSKVPSCCYCGDPWPVFGVEGAKLEKVTIKLPHEMTSGELIPKSPLGRVHVCGWSGFLRKVKNVKLTVPLGFNERDVKSNKNYMSCSTDLVDWPTNLVKWVNGTRGKVFLTSLGIFGYNG
jgi:hypothetical protein